jgi:hypothetical protein
MACDKIFRVSVLQTVLRERWNPAKSRREDQQLLAENPQLRLPAQDPSRLTRHCRSKYRREPATAALIVRDLTWKKGEGMVPSRAYSSHY